MKVIYKNSSLIFRDLTRADSIVETYASAIGSSEYNEPLKRLVQGLLDIDSFDGLAIFPMLGSTFEHKKVNLNPSNTVGYNTLKLLENASNGTNCVEFSNEKAVTTPTGTYAVSGLKEWMYLNDIQCEETAGFKSMFVNGIDFNSERLYINSSTGLVDTSGMYQCIGKRSVACFGSVGGNERVLQFAYGKTGVSDGTVYGYTGLEFKNEVTNTPDVNLYIYDNFGASSKASFTQTPGEAVEKSELLFKGKLYTLAFGIVDISKRETINQLFNDFKNSIER